MTAFEVHPVAAPLRGIAEVPGDKSIGHRAMILGGICDGEVRVTGPRGGADNASTRAARSLVELPVLKSKLPGSTFSWDPIQGVWPFFAWLSLRLPRVMRVTVIDGPSSPVLG